MYLSVFIYLCIGLKASRYHDHRQTNTKLLIENPFESFIHVIRLINTYKCIRTTRYVCFVYVLCKNLPYHRHKKRKIYIYIFIFSINRKPFYHFSVLYIVSIKNSTHANNAGLKF